MRNRSLLTLAAVVIALGAFILLVERHRPSSDDATDRSSRVFPSLEQDTVTELSIRSADGAVRLQQVDGKWRLVEPMDSAADDGSVRSLLRTVTELKAERRLEPGEVDPAEYQLDSPQWELRLTTKDGQEQLLQVGAEVPLSTSRAVRTGSPGIAICSGWFTSELDTDPDHWRSRDVAELYPSDVASIDVVSGGDRVRVARVGERWQLLEPVDDLADRDQMRDLISELNELRVEEFADSSTDAELGLDTPAVELSVLRSEGREPLSLTFGARRLESNVDQVACRRNGTDRFWVRATILTRLGKAPVRWRSPVVWPVDTWEVDRLSVTTPAASAELRRTEGVWRLGDGGDAEPTAVQERLRALSELAAAGFDLVEPQTPLLGEVELELGAAGDEAAETIHYRFFSPLARGGRAAVTVSGRKTVMSVDPAAVEAILGELDALRAKAAEAPADTASPPTAGTEDGE